ncbi:hypothetical protein RE6C_02734 [Rhodopirellula europaea 6C]|uniref:Uncharacterized protein n=1 Tax=Rhodopirellula europaea 6C TaxID=1263867 RepID=M2B2D6_9BACT|nr:hypothetical protein RE6C_02734 [Rhodopirellula europaea 6C]
MSENLLPRRSMKRLFSPSHPRQIQLQDVQQAVAYSYPELPQL